MGGRPYSARSLLARAARWLAIGWPLLLVAVALFAGVLVYTGTLEDAFITFRFAEHFAAGDGFGVWNRGEAPVEGYTSPLWMVFVAAAKRIGLSSGATATITGLFCYAGVVALFATLPRLARRYAVEEPWLRDPWGACAVAAILYVGSAANAWYSTTGMETIPFALLGLAAFSSLYLARRALLPAALHGLLVLLRPEGLLIALASGAFHALMRPERRRAGIACVVTAVSVFSMLTLGRLLYFGYPFPNTYYAKVQGGPPGMHLLHGMAYTSHWMHAHWPWLLAIVLGNLVLWRQRRDRSALRVLASLSVGLCLYAAYVTKVGGDNPYAFPMWRHFVHIGPFVCLASGVAICSLSARTLLRLSAAVALAWLATRSEMRAHPSPFPRGLQPYFARFPADITQSSRNKPYAWLRSISDPRDVIASGLAGNLPYTVDAVHVDMLGLCDSHIAHQGKFDPKGPVDSKTDIAYVLGRRPDVIESNLNRKRLTQGRSRAELVKRRVSMVNAMLDNPIFKSDYCFVRGAPGNRAMFMRKAYAAGDPRRAKLECIPVTETSLYRSSTAPAKRAARRRKTT
jgi:hypothetical protein